MKGGKWLKIGDTEAEAVANVETMFYKTVPNHAEIMRYAMNMVAVARQNAKARGSRKRVIPFDLSRDDIKRLLDACGWKCAVTGTPFSLDKVGTRKPFAPSIDRIRCDEGYHVGNCRIVCVATNYAMNVWGESVLHKLASHMARFSLSTKAPTQAVA